MRCSIPPEGNVPAILVPLSIIHRTGAVTIQRISCVSKGKIIDCYRNLIDAQRQLVRIPFSVFHRRCGFCRVKSIATDRRIRNTCNRYLICVLKWNSCDFEVIIVIDSCMVFLAGKRGRILILCSICLFHCNHELEKVRIIDRVKKNVFGQLIFATKGTSNAFSRNGSRCFLCKRCRLCSCRRLFFGLIAVRRHFRSLLGNSCLLAQEFLQCFICVLYIAVFFLLIR